MKETLKVSEMLLKFEIYVPSGIDVDELRDRKHKKNNVWKGHIISLNLQYHGL